MGATVCDAVAADPALELVAAVDPHAVGQYIQLMEIAVALCGEHYDVDAFDQPGVEAGKIAAYALMGRAGFEARKTEIESAAPREQRSV